MKRIPVLTLAFVLGCFAVPTDASVPTFAQAAAAVPRDPPTMPALRLTLPPVLDGDLSDWQGLPWAPVVSRRQCAFDPDWSGPEDCCGRFRVGWDEQALYLAVEVLDDSQQSDREPLQDDAVEIELGAVAESPGVRQGVWRGRLPMETFETRRRQLLAPGTGGGRPLFGTEGISTEAQGVYRVEVRLLWALLGVTSPAEGQHVAFDLLLHDADRPAGIESTLRWSASKEQGPGAQLELVERLLPEGLRRWATELSVLATDRAYFLSGETGTVALCSGNTGLTAGPWQCFLLQRDGAAVELGSPRRWRNALLTGWEWEVTLDTPGETVLLAARPTEAAAPLLVTEAEECRNRAAQARTAYEALRRELLPLCRSDQHGARGAAAATWWWQHRELERRLADLEAPQKRPDLQWVSTETERLGKGVRQAFDTGAQPPLTKGFHTRAYLSLIDDSLQPYGVYVPPDYDPGRGAAPRPLVVQLHGLGGSYAGGSAPVDFTQCLVVWPNGRGNTDYKAWGELDVLRVLGEVTRDYRVDPDRVYLTGASMGGTGSWQLGVHYPQLFAALAPVCGNVDHRAWQLRFGWVEPKQTLLSPLRDYLESVESNTWFAESLSHVPVYCVHGDKDNVVPVEHSRFMVDRLHTLGYTVTYEEQPNVGHGNFQRNTMRRVNQWLLQQQRDPLPTRVVHKAARLRHGAAYWTAIERFREPLQIASLEAEVTGPNELRLATSNVEQLRLTLRAPLVDPRQPVRLTIDDAAQPPLRLPRDGVLRLERPAPGHGMRWTAPHRPTGLVKHAGLEGPLEEAFLSRFLVVYGTAGDEAETAANHEEALRFRAFWRRWANAECRLKADTEVTPDEVADSNLILFGNDRSNVWIAKVNARLPVRFDGKAVRIGDRRFEGDDVGLKLCYPNPLNPNRYVAVIGGTTWRGTEGALGRFGNWFDWGLFDNRNWFDFGVFDGRTRGPESFLAVGFFDQQWQVDERFMWAGLPEARDTAAPRPAPTALPVDKPGPVVYLSDVKAESVVFEKGALSYDRSFLGRPLQLGDTFYRKGLGVHPNAEMVYDLRGGFHTFSAWVGADLEGETTVLQPRDEAERVLFEVFGDDQLLARFGPLKWNDPPKHVYLNVTGVGELRLVCRRNTGKRWLYGDWDWADAKVTRSPHPRLLPSVTTAPLEAELVLADDWLLEAFEPGKGLEAGVPFEAPDLTSLQAASTGYSYSYGPPKEVRLRARVPGTVQQTLIEAGKLDDPYRGKDAEDASWVHEREWWYRRAFTLPDDWRGRQVTLSLEGLNRNAEVWLNGRALLTARGQWRQPRVEVTQYLRADRENVLAIRLCAGQVGWTGVPKGVALPAAGDALCSQLSLGVRGGPTLVPIGLWQPVTLRATGGVSLTDLTVTTLAASETEAELVVRVTATNHTAQPQQVRLAATVTGVEHPRAPLEVTERVALPAGDSVEVVLPLRMAHASLWWPHHLGPASLYRAQVRAETATGARLDLAEATFGVRTLSASRDELKISGRAVGPLEGAVWLSPDMLLRLPPTRYRHFIGLAKRAGLSAFRVWAGSGPETDAFYDACDEAGMLVVQDFPLTGAAPAEQLRAPFLTAAEDTLRRLRSHPSLLAWVGGSGLDLTDPETAALVAELRRRCLALDPSRPFLDTLPDLGSALSPWQTADHPGLWTFESLPVTTPSVEAAQKWLSPGTYGSREAAWAVHGSELLPATPFGAYRKDDSTTTYSYSYGRDEEAESILQRQLLASVQTARARVAQRPPAQVTGRFWWHWTDPWPAFSRGAVDWTGMPRPSYYALRDGRRPVRVRSDVMPQPTPVGAELVVRTRVETRAQPWRGVLTRQLVTLAGEVLHAEEAEVSASPGQAAQPPPLRWSVPVYQGDRLLLLHSRLRDLTGRPVAEETVPVTTRAAVVVPTVVHVLWITDSPTAVAPLTAALQPAGIAATVRTPTAVAGDLNALAAADVLILDLSAFSEPAAPQLQSLVTSASSSCGIWLYGCPADSETGIVAWARELLPLRWAPTADGKPTVMTTVRNDNHPLFQGLSSLKLPDAPARALLLPSPETQVLLGTRDEQALLVEGSAGPRRLLFLTDSLTGGWGRTLRNEWPEFLPFFGNAVTYLAQLPYPAVERVRATLKQAGPWDPLRWMTQTTLTAQTETKELELHPGQSVTVPVRLSNTGKAAAVLVALDLKSVPAGVLVSADENYFTLFPGESRLVPVTLTVLETLAETATLDLTVSALNAGDPVTAMSFRLVDQRQTAAPATTITNDQDPSGDGDDTQ